MSATIDTSLPLKSPAIHQIDGLQIMRAVAVLLVAWGHMGQGLSSPLPNLGVFGVDIFFSISGFIICSIVFRLKPLAGPSTSWHFLKRRLIRIFPIYWFFCAIFALRFIKDHQFSSARYLPCILLLPSFHYPAMDALVAGSWTLLFEMFFYYTVSVVLLFTVRRAVPCVILLLLLAVSVRSLFSIQHAFLIVVCNPLLLEFLFGAILAILLRRFGKCASLGISLLVLGFALAISLQTLNPRVALGLQAFLTDYLILPRIFTWGIAGAMVVGGILFWSPQIRSVPGKLGIVLGNASYSIYISSPLGNELADRLIQRLFHKLTGLATWQIAFAQCFGLVVIFFVGWLSYKFVERPLLRRLQPFA